LKGSVRRLREIHREAAGAKVAPELLAKQHLDIRFVIDNENEEAHLFPPALLAVASRQDDPEFGEFAWLGIDLN